MASDPEFLILKPAGGWLPAADESRLLGAAVKNYFDPLENSTPSNPMKHYDKKTHRLIDTRFDRLILEKKDVQAKSGKLVIQGLARFICRKKDEKLFNLKSKVIYVKRMTGIDDYWKALTAEDPDFAPKVTEWLEQKRMLGLKSKYEVYLVTGILMCQDIEVATSEAEAKKRLRNFQAKLGDAVEAAAASHGGPISSGGLGNISGEKSKKEHHLTYFEAAGSSRQIFAVQLKRITLKGGRLALGDNGPSVAANRRLGEEKVGGIVLEDLTQEDWAAIVDESDEEVSGKSAVSGEQDPDAK